MPLPIEDYALISDCHSAALVGKNGSIDWLCFPRFDSGACFAALLGSEENGHWSITPADQYEVTRKYIEGTVVLETTFAAASGTCRLTDCLLIGDDHPTLVRSLEGVHGTVNLHLELTLRFDYGSIVPWVRRTPEGHGIYAVAGPDAVNVTSPVALQGKNLHTAADFQIKAGERLSFTMTYYPSHLPRPRRIDRPWIAIRGTIYWWKEWFDRNEYHGFDEEAVSRSLLTLKALIYEPTGAVIAAPTTSLPEKIGGHRNWDYRYSWLRDSSFTLTALLQAGYRGEAERWSAWLLRTVAGNPSQVSIMYGIKGERRLNEVELTWLPGYEDSKPVRIGNDAHTQFQLDVFGELISTLYLARRHGLTYSQEPWRIERHMIDYISSHWSEPDEGIWEIRGPRQHFTHSKVMAWAALDRAVRAIHDFGLDGDLEHWTELRDRIHRDVCEHGFNSEMNSFVQSYDSKELDASLLLLGLVGFLKPSDPRFIGTVEAIQKNLMRDGLVLRYRTSSGVDGLEGDEGSFIACSFWLVEALRNIGREREAHDMYKHLCSLRNDVGLFAEEYCPKTHRMLGNFPQAFSHIAQATTAMNFTHPAVRRPMNVV
jgi:GH15 family glucan-1,4-alpha-glucosidase